MKVLSVFVLALVLSVHVSPAQTSQRNVTIYTDDFAGSSHTLTPGEYDNMYLIRAGIITVKSVKVPKGMKATMYSHDGFEGASLELTEDANTAFLESKGFAQTILSVSIVVEDLASPAATPATVFATIPALPAPPSITIYRDDFSGASKMLAPGSYEPTDLGNVGNDQLSSIRIPAGLKVTLYEHGGFKGRTLVLRKDSRASYLVGNRFNDLTSSILVEVEPATQVVPVTVVGPAAVIATPPATTPITIAGPVEVAQLAEPIIYQGDFSGSSKSIRAGRYGSEELGIGNDQLSSIKIPAGFKVTLYEGDAFEGRTLVLTQDARAAFLADNNFNNVTSSILVEAPPKPQRMVTLYTDDFGGVTQQIAPGKYSWVQLNLGDNALSSIQIPRGLELTIYENETFTGRSMTVRSDTRMDFFTGNAFNDIASAFEVREIFPADLAVIVFADRFGGASQSFTPGRYQLNALTVGDNQISSAKVPQGMRVVMYEQDNFQGYSVTAEGDIDLFQSFNDRVSSLVVEDIFTPVVTPPAKTSGSASKRPGGMGGGTVGAGAAASTPTSTPAGTGSASSAAQPPPCALNPTQYQNAYGAIKAKTWDADKMDIARISTKERCLSLTQIREIGKLFDSEDQAFEFVKYAYDRSSEKPEYYLLQDMFKYPSTQTAFTQFLKSK